MFLRGYDQKQVDDWGKAVRAAGRGEVVAVPAFASVLHGYVVADVDRWVELVRRWASTTGLPQKTDASLPAGPVAGRRKTSA